MVIKTLITLSSSYYTFEGGNGYLHPGDDYSSWWIIGDTSNNCIYLDPGTIVKGSSVELKSTIELVDYMLHTHEDLGELGILIQECYDADNDYYHFTISNIGQQSVKINFGDNIGYVIV